jgi:single-strand DNA-binding protein
MASLNRVFLIGNLTRDPELRYIPSGKAVVSFSLATSRVFTTAQGEKKQQTSFVRIVVWGRAAEVCGEYLAKGSLVFVEGTLQSRSWKDQEGKPRSTIEVVANRVQFLDRTKKKETTLPVDEIMPLDEDTVQSAQETSADASVPKDVDAAGQEEAPF